MSHPLYIICYFNVVYMRTISPSVFRFINTICISKYSVHQRNVQVYWWGWLFFLQTWKQKQWWKADSKGRSTGQCGRNKNELYQHIRQKQNFDSMHGFICVVLCQKWWVYQSELTTRLVLSTHSTHVSRKLKKEPKELEVYAFNLSYFVEKRKSNKIIIW